jgi:hypothetical protein
MFSNMKVYFHCTEIIVTGNIKYTFVHHIFISLHNSTILDITRLWVSIFGYVTQERRGFSSITLQICII